MTKTARLLSLEAFEQVEMMADERQGNGAGSGYVETHGLGEFSEPWLINPTPVDLLDAPLDFFFAEHHRQRQAAIVLHLVADGEFDREGVSNLIAFLENDFALHVGDEELGFFPILKQCCNPEDDIEPLLKRLADEHKDDETIGDEALSIIKRRLAGEKLKPDDQRSLRRFADHIRQHLAVENAVLLPIARLRMDADSLETLSTILKQRHAGSPG